jgi:hypothetical protein
MSVPRILTRGQPNPLRIAIAKSGYPSYVVAAMARINPYELSRYCNNKRIPTHHLARLAEVLGEDEDTLQYVDREYDEDDDPEA